MLLYILITRYEYYSKRLMQANWLGSPLKDGYGIITLIWQWEKWDRNGLAWKFILFTSIFYIFHFWLKNYPFNIVWSWFFFFSFSLILPTFLLPQFYVLLSLKKEKTKMEIETNKQKISKTKIKWEKIYKSKLSLLCTGQLCRAQGLPQSVFRVSTCFL